MPKDDPDPRPWEHARKEERISQVFPAVRARLAQRDLRARHRDRLAGVGEEKRQDRSRVRERVGAAQDDEPRVQVPVGRDEGGDRVPVCLSALGLTTKHGSSIRD